MSRIQHKRAHHARLAIKLTSDIVDIGTSHVIPCYEPKMAGPDGAQIEYNALRDNRAVSPGAVNMIFRKFSDKIPLFLPYNDVDVTELTALFERILCPAGMNKVTISLGDFTPEADGFRFTSSDLASADNYESAILAYEEVKTREIMKLCQSEFSINLDTAGACELAYEFMGSDGGVYDLQTAPTWSPDMPSGFQTDLLAYPSTCGVKPVFRNAEFLITPLDDSITDYLAIKTYNFTMGNQLALRDDGCAENGIAGVALGGLLTNQSHKMSIEMPAAHSNFPYQTYFKEGTLLKYTITLIGNSTDRYGIRLKGVLRVNSAIDRGERNNIRTIDLAGVGTVGNDNIPPFEFIIGTALTS